MGKFSVICSKRFCLNLSNITLANYKYNSILNIGMQNSQKFIIYISSIFFLIFFTVFYYFSSFFFIARLAMQSNKKRNKKKKIKTIKKKKKKCKCTLLLWICVALFSYLFYVKDLLLLLVVLSLREVSCFIESSIELDHYFQMVAASELGKGKALS